MSDWIESDLASLTLKIGSGATPRGGKESYFNEGISLIRSQNVLDFCFSKNGLAFIDKEQAEALKNVTIEENDILLNITGDSVARVCLTPKEYLPARVNQHVAIIRCDKTKIDYRFLLYYLLNPHYKRLLLKISSDGGTRKALTKFDIESLLIQHPVKIDDQKEIAKVLFCLDSKIDNLQQQNQTLEKIAQTLFKQWFVDFNFPDENGKPYKDNGGEMVGSELGEIPKGWRVSKLLAFGKVICGKTPPKKSDKYYSKDIPFIKIPDMHDNIFVIESTDHLSLEGSKTQQNKLLPANSILVSCIATVGLVAINSRPSHTNQQINAIIIKEPFFREYLFLNLKRMKSFLLALGSGGSATLNINTSTFGNIEILFPKKEKLYEFHYLVSGRPETPILKFSGADT